MVRAAWRAPHMKELGDAMMAMKAISFCPGLWVWVCISVAALCACAVRSSALHGATGAGAPLKLETEDDGKQIKLLVRHPEIGLVCELWCYEGRPFGYGKATRRQDGSVVLVHTSGKMT